MHNMKNKIYLHFFNLQSSPFTSTTSRLPRITIAVMIFMVLIFCVHLPNGWLMKLCMIKFSCFVLCFCKGFSLPENFSVFVMVLHLYLSRFSETLSFHADLTFPRMRKESFEWSFSLVNIRLYVEWNCNYIAILDFNCNIRLLLQWKALGH